MLIRVVAAACEARKVGQEHHSSLGQPSTKSEGFEAWHEAKAPAVFGEVKGAAWVDKRSKHRAQ